MKLKITNILIYSTIFWFSAILISPIFGIHLHHNPEQNSITIIHSYLSENHETSRTTDESDPQTLIDHISGSGLAKDMGNWDLSIVAIVSVLFFALHLLIRNFNHLVFINIVQEYITFFIRNPEENFNDFRNFQLFLFKLPPPSFN